MQVAKPCGCSNSQVFEILVLSQYLVAQPFYELIFIGKRGLSESKKLADLSTVIFDCAPSPVILQVKGRIEAKLFCHVCDRCTRHLVLRIGKSSFQSWKNLRRRAKPNLVAPVLLSSKANSLGNNVQSSTSSSVVQLRFMAVLHSPFPAISNR